MFVYVADLMLYCNAVGLQYVKNAKQFTISWNCSIKYSVDVTPEVQSKSQIPHYVNISSKYVDLVN